MQDIAETYRTTPDDDLIRLHADISNLIPEAREALVAEMQRRGLTDNQIVAQEEQWKQEAAEEARDEQEKRKKRPIRWLKIITQICIVFAVGILYALATEVSGRWTIPEGQEAIGGLIGSATILALGIAMSFFRERLVATIVMTLTLYTLITVWLFVLH
jgi:hypothetical protein